MFSKKINYNKKDELKLGSSRPIFDIDDLSFFRFYGLGLRHAFLEQGVREAQEGNDRGDAVSLANYGDDSKSEKPVFNQATCERFQKKVEEYILESYRRFHWPAQHYNDAAFLLLMRGDDARFPYDYLNYPLGKCGTKAFGAQQVMSLMKSDQYENEDVTHAAHNSLMNLKEVCRQLKLQEANKLLGRLKQMNGPIASELLKLVNVMIRHYKNNIFVEAPIFAEIAELCDKLESKKSLSIDYLTDKLDELNQSMANINESDKKGENPIVVIYHPVDFDSLSVQELSQQLIHFIKNQNLKNVRECLKRLPKGVFNPDKDPKMQNPLQMAARGQDVAILQATYEFNPSDYDALVANETLATPIFIAGQESRLENLKYLLGVRPVCLRDITLEEMHMFTTIAFDANEKSYEIMKILINRGSSIGNEIKEISKNPLAQCVVEAYENNMSRRKLELLLPHANAWSKYLGIFNTTNELYYIYGKRKRQKIDYEDDDGRTQRLFELRNIILDSLTEKECEEIREFFLLKDVPYPGCDHIKRILPDDLLNFESKIDHGPRKNVAANIYRCFSKPELVAIPSSVADSKPIPQLPIKSIDKKIETSSVAAVNGTLFSHSPPKSDPQIISPEHLNQLVKTSTTLSTN